VKRIRLDGHRAFCAYIYLFTGLALLCIAIALTKG
jgi:hypothetical protein